MLETKKTPGKKEKSQSTSQSRSQEELKKGIWVILGLSLFNYFGSSAWDVIFPEIVQRAAGSVSLWGYAYAAFNATKFIFQIPNANLSDKIGRRKVIAICLFLFGIGSTLTLWAYQDWILVLARAIQGAGAMSAVFLAAIADYTEGREKGLIVAGRNLTQTLGWILGMMVGGLIGEYVGIEAAIALCIVVGFSGGILSLIFLKDQAKNEIVHLKKEINKAHWLKQTLKIPEYDYGLIFGSLRYLLYQAIVSYIMWFLAEEWSVSGSKRVVFLLPVIVFYIIGLLTAGKFTGPKKTNLVFVVLGFSLICLGSAAIFYISESRNSLLLISMLAVVSLGFGFAHNTLTTAMVGNLPEDNKGSALGFAMTVNYACIIVAPLMMSESAARWGPAVPFMVVAVFSLVVSFLALLFGLKFLLRVEG